MRRKNLEFSSIRKKNSTWPYTSPIYHLYKNLILGYEQTKNIDYLTKNQKMSKVFKLYIPVKMGSKHFKIEYKYSYNDFRLCVPQLIEIVLKKVYPKTKKCDQLKNTYLVFENVLGVERQIGNRENILNVLANQAGLDCEIYFIIRKNGARSNQQKLDARKCYDKLRKMKNEGFDSHENQLKGNILQQIIKNEIVLDQQLKKLETFDTVMQKEKKKCVKTNLFQSFYSKMKSSHKKYLKKNIDLNKSKALLLDSAGECTSSSSSRNSSFSKLDTLF
ncbi:hypothetical protein BpHYR1_043758 [Brachionus plicatilis]|uniref:Uncharacterized protein n=1 Tax=Brachionus plicatilis TaxID=10195 RepID=A0A3M7Q0K7_BRAPC|nr:hypothetical protein BpHYR1_043758 [Brachionus plicatilis]